MPCLNEAETVATCVRKAIGFLAESGISGEVLVADNGSTDGSQQLAAEAGARVVPISDKGYGNALMGGIIAANGKYVIMGEAGRSRPPPLHTWRDGWRHLRFLLLFSPRWLFFLPGLALLIAGLVIGLLVIPGPFSIGSVTFDVNTLVAASAMVVIGFQSVLVWLFTQVYAGSAGFLPEEPQVQ